MALTIDDATNEMSVYLDGEVIGTMTGNGPIEYDNSPDTYIGRSGDGTSGFDFNGLIDDARVYSRALSSDEIAAIADEQVVGSGPAETIGPDLTQTFDATGGDNTATNLLFIHDDFGGITSTGTISGLQIGPDSDSTPIDFDLLVLRPNGSGGFDVVHRVSFTDSDIVSTDGNGVRTLNIGTLDVQAGDVIGHWSANAAGSIPYNAGSGGSTGWSSYATGDLDVGDTVTESNNSTNARVYGLNFTFEPDNTNLQTNDSVEITVNAVNDAPTLTRIDEIGFESYTPGNLNGQNGWTTEKFNTSNDIAVTTAAGADGGTALRFNSVGPGVGVSASLVGDDALPDLTDANNVTIEWSTMNSTWGGVFAIGI